MEIKGIDVSSYNPVTDYSAVADSGIRTAILRIAQSGNRIDPSFEKNYKGFRSRNISVGVYKYSYALNAAQAREEAQRVLEILNNRPLEYPVFYDMEWSRQRTLGASAITKIIKAFRKVIVDGGYLFGIYCNTNWYYHVLDTKSLPYDYWLAAYPYNDRGVLVESLRPPVGIGWQYSSKGRVPGISGNVDLDVFYKNYSQDPAPAPDYLTYTIQAGDTLTSIAKKYNTTVKLLTALNNISDPDLIYAGSTLKIPR